MRPVLAVGQAEELTDWNQPGPTRTADPKAVADWMAVTDRWVQPPRTEGAIPVVEQVGVATELERLVVVAEAGGAPVAKAGWVAPGSTAHKPN